MGNLTDPYKRYAERLKEAHEEQERHHRKLDRLESEVRGHKQRMKKHVPFSEGDPVLHRKNSPKGHKYGFIYFLKVRKTTGGNFRVFADLCTPDENGEFPDDPREEENKWAENVNIAELNDWEPPEERNSPVDPDAHDFDVTKWCPNCGAKRDFYLVEKRPEEQSNQYPDRIEYASLCEWCGFARSDTKVKYPNG